MRSESARALIAAAKREEPSPALEGAVLGALGVSATALAAPSLATKLWLALRQAAVSKLSVGVIAIAAASGGYAAGRMHPRAAPVRLEPTTRTSTSTVTPRVTATATATAAATATVTATVTATATAPAPVRVSSKPARKSPSLADEIASIQRARAALLTGDGKSALDELGLYDDLHPHGELREEALALRVRAERLVGDEPAASRALELLSTEFPRSVQLEALRK